MKLAALFLLVAVDSIALVAVFVIEWHVRHLLDDVKKLLRAQGGVL